MSFGRLVFTLRLWLKCSVSTNMLVNRVEFECGFWVRAIRGVHIGSTLSMHW